MKVLHKIKHIILLILILNSSIAFCESKFLSPYYSKIHKAEILICEGNYLEAIKLYKSAFQYKIYFSIDIYNALICTGKVSDFKSFKEISYYAIKAGIPVSIFKKSIFIDIIKHPMYKKLFFQLEKQSEIIKAKNKEYNEKIEALFKMDQFYRINENLDSIKHYDNLVCDSMKKYISSFGFPSERKIGVLMKNDTTILSNSLVDIILQHQMKYNACISLQDIIQYIQYGEMRSSKLSYFSTWKPEFNIELGCGDQEIVYAQVNDQLYICSKDKESIIDRYREKYFLEPLHELKIKINFHYFIDNSFKLTGYNYVYSERTDPSSRIKELQNAGMELFKILNSIDPYFKPRR
jgi:hypothetical protein